MKKVLAFVLTVGFMIALTTTVGCSKKETDAPKTEAAKTDAKAKTEANK